MRWTALQEKIILAYHIDSEAPHDRIARAAGSSRGYTSHTIRLYLKEAKSWEVPPLEWVELTVNVNDWEIIDD